MPGDLDRDPNRVTGASRAARPGRTLFGVVTARATDWGLALPGRVAVRDRGDDPIRRPARRRLGFRRARRRRLRAGGRAGLEAAAGVAAARAAEALGPGHRGGRGRSQPGRGDAALRGGLVERPRAVGGRLQPARLALRARDRAHGRGRCARGPARQAVAAPGRGRAPAVPPRGRARRRVLSGLGAAASAVGLGRPARCPAPLHGLLRGRLVRWQHLPLNLVGRGQSPARCRTTPIASSWAGWSLARCASRWRSFRPTTRWWPRSTAPAASTRASAGAACASPACSSGAARCLRPATCA
jgi:hypothetical protein